MDEYPESGVIGWCSDTFGRLAADERMDGSTF